jgi:K+:H+ antiporter
MAVTAFPVLARILWERGLHRTRVGGLALTCAAVGDIVAWSVLALVIAMVGADSDQWRLLFAVPYLLIMLFAVRPLLRRLAVGREPGRSSLVVIVVVVMLSAASTEWMGLHFIFGAFFAGVLMPRSGAQRLTDLVHDRVGTFGTMFLLPIFFVAAGLQVDLSRLTLGGLGQMGLILLTAIGGKLGGAYLGARLRRERPKDAAVVAVLMNTRGLTELIVLSVGLQLGILDVQLYSLLVVMALVTTAMTGPLLSVLFRRNGMPEPEPAPEAQSAERA